MANYRLTQSVIDAINKSTEQSRIFGHSVQLHCDNKYVLNHIS